MENIDKSTKKYTYTFLTQTQIHTIKNSPQQKKRYQERSLIDFSSSFSTANSHIPIMLKIAFQNPRASDKHYQLSPPLHLLFLTVPASDFIPVSSGQFSCTDVKFSLTTNQYAKNSKFLKTNLSVCFSTFPN